MSCCGCVRGGGFGECRRPQDIINCSMKSRSNLMSAISLASDGKYGPFICTNALLLFCAPVESWPPLLSFSHLPAVCERTQLIKTDQHARTHKARRINFAIRISARAHFQMSRHCRAFVFKFAGNRRAVQFSFRPGEFFVRL